MRPEPRKGKISSGSPTTVSRIGAVADVHYGRDKDTRLRPLFEGVSGKVDVLLLGGDLTDFGLPE
jgi:hypothetical protein